MRALGRAYRAFCIHIGFSAVKPVITWGRWRGEFWLFVDGQPIEALTLHAFRDLSDGFLGTLNAKQNSKVHGKTPQGS